MIKVFYDKQTSSNYKLDVTITGSFLKVLVSNTMTGEEIGFDVVKRLFPYNSYGLIERDSGKVKIYRRTFNSNIKFLDLCRLGYSSKMDFADIARLYGGNNMLLQVDTGIISGSLKDIILMPYAFSPNNIHIEADEEVTYEEINFKEYGELQEPKRFSFWDKYSLKANDREVKANMRGEVISGDFDSPFIGSNNIIHFTITKYKGEDFATLLNREEDNEEVFIETSAGIADTRRVRLVNGVGSFNLNTLGYSGDIKIKLGRKWYSVWNDYALKVK